MNREQANLLFPVIAKRYEVGSLILTDLQSAVWAMGSDVCKRCHPDGGAT
jgi:hypothetical protein